MKPWEQVQAQINTMESPQAAAEGGASASPWQKFTNMVSQGMFGSVTNGPTEYKQKQETPWEKAAATPKQAPSGEKFEQVFNALIKQESGGKHMDAKGNLTTSPVGAKGVTQVMPKTARDPGYGVQPIKDDSHGEYVRFGRDYLTAMLKEFDGDYQKALGAYNAGAGNVKKALLKAAKAGDDDWQAHLPKKSETVPYIRNIMKGIK